MRIKPECVEYKKKDISSETKNEIVGRSNKIKLRDKRKMGKLGECGKKGFDSMWSIECECREQKKL